MGRLATDETLNKVVDAIKNSETVQAQKKEIQAEGARVLTTIPQDYKKTVEEVNSIKEDLEKLDDFISQTELEVINGEYLSFGGVITQNNGFGRTNYIPCDGYSGIKVYTPIETSLCGFFDADKNFIKQFTAKSGTHNVIVPYNACYYMLSNNKENIGLMRVEISEHSKDVSEVNRIKSLLCVKRVTEDVKVNYEFKQGFYPIKASAITPSEWYESYLFNVAMGDVISYRGQTNATSVLYDYIRIFDKEENIIDTKPNEIGLKNVSGDIVIRNTNASKVLITLLKGNSSITRTFSDVSTDRDKYKKIVWFGTSIPEGRYNGVGTSYPEIIGKKLGITVYNEAVGSSRVHGYRRKNYISSENPYGFMPNGHFTNAAKSITDDAECKEWIIEHWRDDTYFPNGRFSTMAEADKETIRNWGYERKLDKYLTTETFPDMFVFDYGRNDMWSSIDWTFDESDPDNVYTSFQNAMNFLIRRILNYNNRAKIVIVGHYSNQERSALDPTSVKDFPDMCAKGQMEVAEYWELPLCKLWELTGWSNKIIKVNGKDISVLCSWLPDALHPHSDTTGRAINHIANLLAPFIREQLLS